MSVWAVNMAALLLAALSLMAFAVALLWRVGGWRIAPAASLSLDEGLKLGAEAPQVACMAGEQEFHLGFGGPRTMVVFGTSRCEPCKSLLEAASRHPVTRGMRLVYVGDSEEIDIDSDARLKWEIYRFHNEKSARSMWRAPVSPYFHLINEEGRIIDKGVASHAEHLNRFVSLPPPLSQVQ